MVVRFLVRVIGWKIMKFVEVWERSYEFFFGFNFNFKFYFGF